MKIFVFDTETTWFINKKDPSLEVQPKIIQFAWILGNLEDWEWKEIERINILVNPKMSIPFDSSKVHHIYDVDVKNAPFIEEKIDEFLKYINESDVIVWHNIEYDEDMIKIELKRLEKEYLYQPKQVICTMKTTVDFVAVKWNWERFKYPKLWELHKKLFEEYFIWAHDAMVDVEATARCFVELVNKWVLKLEKKEEALTLF